MNQTKKLGDQGTLIIAADLLKKDYYVFGEFGDNSAIDLIAVDSKNPKKMIRFQAKTATINRGKITVYGDNSTRSYHRVYTADDFDYFALFVHERNMILYIPIADVITENGFRMDIRIDPAKNGQTKRVNDYRKYLNF